MYRFSEAYCKRWAMAWAVTCAIMIAIGSIIPTYSAFANISDIDPKYALIAVLLAVLFTCVFGGFISWRTYRRHRASLQRIQVILERDELTRVASGLRDLTLFKDEVTEIVETPGRGLVVRTADPGRAIGVPSAFVGYEELREELARWTPIRIRRASLLRDRAVVIALYASLAAAYLVAAVSTSPFVVASCAAYLFLFVAWVIWSTLRNSQFDLRVKLSSFVFFLPLMPIILKLCLVLGYIGNP